MDASGSLYYDNYKKEKEFVKQVIDQQSIGRRQTRVSVMSYSTTATIHVRFDQYFDKASLRRAVDDIPYESLMTRIDRALALAKSKMFTEANGARPYARRVRRLEVLFKFSALSVCSCVAMMQFKKTRFFFHNTQIT